MTIVAVLDSVVRKTQAGNFPHLTDLEKALDRARLEFQRAESSEDKSLAYAKLHVAEMDLFQEQFQIVTEIKAKSWLEFEQALENNELQKMSQEAKLLREELENLLKK